MRSKIAEIDGNPLMHTDYGHDLDLTVHTCPDLKGYSRIENSLPDVAFPRKLSNLSPLLVPMYFIE